jgi:REP element-mobilizing transposase RayT
MVWITKYRYKILRGRVAERARDLIRQSCEARDEKTIREYIESQKWDDKDRGFKITAPAEP